MKPIKSHLIYQPLPGKDEELARLMKEYIEVLRRQGFITTNTPPLVAVPGYLVETFEWIDNDEELEEAAGNHPDIIPIRRKMIALSAIPNMKELQRIAKALKK